MIFVTVGTQLPFDRLIRIVDEYAAKSCVHIVGQIGNGKYVPKNIEWRRFYSPDELNRVIKKSTVVVSHAGMGSIISCIGLCKSIIIFPRLKSLGEHRNNHQLDTVDSYKGVKGVYGAKDESCLIAYLKKYKSLSKPVGLDSSERDKLLHFILEQL